MEIENLWDFLLTTSIIVGCVLLVLWGLLLLAGSFRRKKSTREKKPEPAKKTVISDHHPKTGGDHDHDDHHGHGGGGLLKWGLGILLLGLFCWFVALPWLKGLGFGQVPGASAEVRYAMAPQGTIPGRQEPVSISCKNEEAVTAVIAPGGSVSIHVPPRTRIDFTPSVDTGSVSFCSSSRPDQCDPTGPEGIFVPEDTFTVTNLGTESVNFRCWYSSL